MRILLDHDFDAGGNIVATQFLHTDAAPGNVVDHPTIPGQKLTHINFLGFLNGKPALQAAAGYAIVSQLPGELAPRSRWARIVEACNAAPALSPEKGLNLV